MNALQDLWAMLNTPSKFDGDPYGGLMNQWGHYAIGVALFCLACAAHFAVFGEMPRRFWAAGLLVAAYFLVIECWVQGWQGKDSLEDAGYFGFGAFTPAASIKEIGFSGDVSTLLLNVGVMAAWITCAILACLYYGIKRIPPK